MNIDLMLKNAIIDAFKSLFDIDIPEEQVKTQPTNKEFKGTHTFVTFPFLRMTRKNPEESGKMIGQFLKDNTELISDFNVVKGFLNLEISSRIWLNGFIEDYLNKSWGRQKPKNQKVMVEYSSPNTNKPLHLGHLRNNFLGFSVSRILEAAGYQVMKVNLVNDRGIHICKSMVAYQKFGAGETPESSGIKGDHLIGRYYVIFDKKYKAEINELIAGGMSREEAEKSAPLLNEAKNMLQKWEQKDAEIMSLWEKMNGWVYQGFDITYRNIGVSFDKTLHESETYLLGKDIVEEGLLKGIFYRRDDGSVWIDLTKEGLDEKLLLRSDGTSVYMTQDLGTADLKHDLFPFDKSIYVVGNEQDYHFDILFLILKKLGRTYAEGMYHLSYGMVDLPSGKMKSREGTVVDADDLVTEMETTAQNQTEELGKIEGFSDGQLSTLYHDLAMGALKYFLLKIDPKKRMLFNPQESIQFIGNTGPFIQYTHARISAIERKAVELGIDMKKPNALPEWVLHETELELIRQITRFTEVIEEAAESYAPSVVANYCYDLAKAYNRFYTEVSIFNESNMERRNFRVSLSVFTAKTIKLGMSLLGIHVPDRM